MAPDGAEGGAEEAAGAGGLDVGAAAGAEGTAGAGGAEGAGVLSAAPHCLQNFAPIGDGAPHFGHGMVDADAMLGAPRG